MYTPPPIEILNGLTGSDLVSICHGLSTVSLRFENGNLLNFSAPFRIAQENVLLASAVLEFPLSESLFVRLLGHEIIQIECDSDGTLKLQFSNRDVLIVYANDPAYEAYMLVIDGKEYRV
jgi:hypothetical protein